MMCAEDYRAILGRKVALEVALEQLGMELRPYRASKTMHRLLRNRKVLMSRGSLDDVWCCLQREAAEVLVSSEDAVRARRARAAYR